MLWWYSWGSVPAATIPKEGGDVNSGTPTPGCSLIWDYFREASYQHSIPCHVGEGLNGNQHQQWPKNKWGSHPNGDLGYRWGGVRTPGHGDHLMSPWSIQDGGFQCTLCPTSMWLAGAKCGCSEKVHQHSLYPSRALPSPLSRCEHTLWEHFLCPIPTGLAMSMQIDPLPDTEVVLPWQEGDLGLKVFPHFQEALWQSSEEQHYLSNPISLSFPLLAPHLYQEEGT